MVQGDGVVPRTSGITIRYGQRRDLIKGAKVVIAVDDHSHYCVIAKVVERATGRAVCLALTEALVRFGVPEAAGPAQLGSAASPMHRDTGAPNPISMI